MIRRRPLAVAFYLNVLVVLLALGYKLYLDFGKPELQAEHSRQLLALEQRLAGRESYSFAVVGNAKNSIGIFERMIIPELNAAGLDFVVSAGNAVSGGGEDKYRALHGTLSHLEIPYLLTVGETEAEAFGNLRFYENFGPLFYSLTLDSSRLIFVDSSGTTPDAWQTRWLEDVLSRSTALRTFIFVNHPLQRVDIELPFTDEEDYLCPQPLRDALHRLLRRHPVDAVFSAQLPLFHRGDIAGTDAIVTGGAGGLVLNTAQSDHHYVRVDVSPEGVEISRISRPVSQHPVLRQLESLWFFIYSLFYAGYLNFILLVSLLAAVAIWLYGLLFAERDYYPNLDIDPGPWLQRPLRVAMVADNYLPFIGGVPIAVERLRQGLIALGHRVFLIAPSYPTAQQSTADCLRVPSLTVAGPWRDFRIANIAWPGIARGLRQFAPDIVHVHHPFWLSLRGRAVARRLGCPVVYTYHTRLEHYAHFVPLPGRLFRNFVSHLIVRRFTRHCDAVIVPTLAAEEYLRAIGVRRPVHLQPTGVDFEAYQQVKADEVGRLAQQLGLSGERVIVSVSRLSREKNIDFMLDALARLDTTAVGAYRFLLIGDGAERKRLQDRIQTLGLAQQVTLVGAVPPAEMPVYYRLADVFAFASRSETQGMVILEAMAAGLPVVAVRSSGIDDVIRDGITGYKTALDPGAWLHRLQALLRDDALRRQLAGQAREFARQHDYREAAANVQRIYATVLANRQSS